VWLGVGARASELGSPDPSDCLFHLDPATYLNQKSAGDMFTNSCRDVLLTMSCLVLT